ncbi:hypothetical protein BURPSPAST_E0237 [Burkholderia pseudomallei Pasteur 52237]|nr:hypothetical protein BURPSPAST_E0237 [Burkholderia pseudomallei Pasteur 52237]
MPIEPLLASTRPASRAIRPSAVRRLSESNEVEIMNGFALR